MGSEVYVYGPAHGGERVSALSCLHADSASMLLSSSATCSNPQARALTSLLEQQHNAPTQLHIQSMASASAGDIAPSANGFQHDCIVNCSPCATFSNRVTGCWLCAV